MRSGGCEIHLGTAVIEEDADVGITKRGFDDSSVQSGAADGIDVLPRIAVVGREMQLARLLMDHPARHRNRMAKDFIGDTELFEGMDATSGKGEVDRAAADNITLTRIGPTLVKFDVVTP